MCCCNAIGLKIFFRRSSAKWNFLLCAINVYKNSRVVRGVFHVGAGLTQAGACPLPRRSYDLMVFKKVQFDSARMPFPARHHLCSSSMPFQLSRLLEVLPVTKKTCFVSKKMENLQFSIFPCNIPSSTCKALATHSIILIGSWYFWYVRKGREGLWEAKEVWWLWHWCREVSGLTLG